MIYKVEHPFCSAALETQLRMQGVRPGGAPEGSGTLPLEVAFPAEEDACVAEAEEEEGVETAVLEEEPEAPAPDDED
jgi:hypothetical protein